MTNNAKAKPVSKPQEDPIIPSNLDDAPAAIATKKQRNFPNLPLQKALSVAYAIQDGASGMNVNRLTLAELMRNSPSSSMFQGLLQASRMYGLTSGGVNAQTFALTTRGIAATLGDEIAKQQALREAVLSVEPYKKFLTSLDNKKVPAPNVCKEVLVNRCSVPAERADECMRSLLADAQFVGFIRKVQGNDWVELQSTPLPSTNAGSSQSNVINNADDDDIAIEVSEQDKATETPHLSVVRPVADEPPQWPTQAKKVFIAHGRDHGPLDQVKKMLDQLKVKYAVAVDEPNRGRPISVKVASLMKEECSSAIFIFTADEHFNKIDEQDNQIDIWRPSENVIYELGAALILYDTRIVIFKDKRIKLPSDFADLGYIDFDEDKIVMQMGQLISELVSLDILEVRAKG